MAGDALDYKKAYKDLYMPKAKPVLIDVPAMTFIMVDGKGNPNTEGGEYQQAVELLYALCYTVKMSKMGKNKPEGYFDYVVPPLEGLWWLEGDAYFEPSSKERFCWTSMIRQPDFVTPEVFERTCREVSAKKPQLDLSKARLQVFCEGLCVQMMHIGLYDDEPATVAQMDAFIRENGYRNAISDVLPDGTARRHHEIYLGDPRKIEPQKRKTVVRHPVKAV